VDGLHGNLQLEGTARELDGPADEQAVQRYTDKYGPSTYLTYDHSTRFRVGTDRARLLVNRSFPPSQVMVLGEGKADFHR
jgi:hypothetical protein